jgi:hypothetical protein
VLERLTGKRSTAEVLSPLDAYLLHLVLEFCPTPIRVADLACEATRGATSLVCLRNKNVVGVVASAGCDHVLRGLVDSLDELDGLGSRKAGRRSTLSFVDEPAGMMEHFALEGSAMAELPVFLIEPAALDHGLDQTLETLLEGYPHKLVLVLSVGKAGESRLLETLVRACRDGSPSRLWLLRETSGALSASGLALVAPRDLAFVPSLMLRLEQLFTTNYDFLRLVHDSYMYAVERGLLDQSEVKVLPLRSRLEAVEQALGLAQQELATTQQQLATTQQQLSTTQDEMSIARQQLDREYLRPVVRALALQSGRRIAHFVRRHRSVLVPAGSHRERIARKVMRVQRRLRGKAA